MGGPKGGRCIRGVEKKEPGRTGLRDCKRVSLFLINVVFSSSVSSHPRLSFSASPLPSSPSSFSSPSLLPLFRSASLPCVAAAVRSPRRSMLAFAFVFVSFSPCSLHCVPPAFLPPTPLPSRSSVGAFLQVAWPCTFAARASGTSRGAPRAQLPREEMQSATHARRTRMRGEENTERCRARAGTSIGARRKTTEEMADRSAAKRGTEQRKRAAGRRSPRHDAGKKKKEKKKTKSWKRPVCVMHPLQPHGLPLIGLA